MERIVISSEAHLKVSSVSTPHGIICRMEGFEIWSEYMMMSPPTLLPSYFGVTVPFHTLEVAPSSILANELTAERVRQLSILESVMQMMFS